MNSCAAASRLVRPFGDQLRDAPLRFGELVRRGRAEADSLKLASGLVDPSRRAKPFEYGDRLGQCVGRGALLARSAKQPALEKECPSELERQP